jgi:hypothetical protein
MGILEEIFKFKNSKPLRVGHTATSIRGSIAGLIKKSGRGYNSDDNSIIISSGSSLLIPEAEALIGQVVKSIVADRYKLIITFESGDTFIVDGMTIDEDGKKDDLDTKFTKKTLKV